MRSHEYQYFDIIINDINILYFFFLSFIFWKNNDISAKKNDIFNDISAKK